MLYLVGDILVVVECLDEEPTQSIFDDILVLLSPQGIVVDCLDEETTSPMLELVGNILGQDHGDGNTLVHDRTDSREGVVE